MYDTFLNFHPKLKTVYEL